MLGLGKRRTRIWSIWSRPKEVRPRDDRGRRSLCAQLAGFECPSLYDAALGVLSNREMVTGRHVLARESAPKCVKVDLPIKVRVERSRLSALVEVTTARESRVKSEMTGEALIARESRPKSETTGEALMA